MRIKRIVGAAAATLAAVAALGAGAGTAQAAAGPDLKITQCEVKDDPVNYGDGIDWYYFTVSYKNVGGTATGSVKNTTAQVWTGPSNAPAPNGATR